MHGHEFRLLVAFGGPARPVARADYPDCVPLLLERDQYPLHHVVIIATKATTQPPQREHLLQEQP